MQKNKITKLMLSPKTPSKSFKPSKHSLSSPKAQTDRAENLRETIELLTEEKNLLYEYKIATVPKIKKLIENLDKSELELQKKEGEIKKLKSFYESEISCMQDYINILKSSGNTKIEEQLKSEKARSMTFYRALTKKQQECDASKESLLKVKELESQVNSLEEQLKKIRKGEAERLKENEKISQNFNHLAKDSLSLNRSSNDLSEMIRNLKEEIKERMNENITQVINNFSLFTSKIKKMNEKLDILEDNQKELSSNLSSSKVLKDEIMNLKKEKLDLQKTLEKNYKENINDIKSYEEEIERLKRKIKVFSQDSVENKLMNEEKLRKKSLEIQEVREKCRIAEEEKKNIEKNLENLEQNDLIIEQLNQENQKLTETQKNLEKQLRDLKTSFSSLIQEKTSILKENSLHQVMIKDLKDSYMKVQSELSKAQLEITKLQEDLGKAQSDLTKSQSNLCKSQSDLSKTQSELIKVQIENANFQELSLKTRSSESSSEKPKSFALDKQTNIFCSSSLITSKASSSNSSEKLLKKSEKLKKIKQELQSLKDSQKQDSQLSDSLIVTSTQEENNIIRQEIDSLREEKRFFQLENEALTSEKKSLAALLKTLQNQVEKMTEDRASLEEDRSRVFKELTIANDVIFHNKKILDSSLVVTESEHPETLKLQRKVEELNEELVIEKKQHEETVINLIEADRRIESLIIQLKHSKDLIGQREAELEEFQESVLAVTTTMQELRIKYQVSLERYQELLNESAEKEKKYLNNLELVQKYDKEIAGLEEQLEKRRVLVEELQEVIEDYKEETTKSQEKIKKLEKDLERIGKNVNENLELRKKIMDLNTPAKEYSLDKTISEESSKEFEDLDKINSKHLAFESLFFQLFNEELTTFLSEKQKVLLEKLKKDLKSIKSQNFQEIQGKVKKLQRKIKDLRKKYQILILNLESTQEENLILIEKLKNLRKIQENEDFQKFPEIAELDSLSLDCKQLSSIESEESLEKIQELRAENEKINEELEKFKESTLGYSVSEGETMRKPDDELSANWTDGEIEKMNPKLMPKAPEKVKSGKDDMLIIDPSYSSSRSGVFSPNNRSGISSPDIDISDDVIFEST
jgi:chromosome segregation ATPase